MVPTKDFGDSFFQFVVSLLEFFGVSSPRCCSFCLRFHFCFFFLSSFFCCCLLFLGLDPGDLRLSCIQLRFLPC